MTSTHRKVIGVLLTYKQAHLIEQTYNNLPKELFDEIIIADDNSQDGTNEVGKRLGLKVITAPRTGYGGNWKRAFNYAKREGFDYIVEIHGDGQYGPEMIEPGLQKINQGFDLVLGSRFTNIFQPLRDHMSLVRWLANIGLSLTERLVLQLPLTEFHSGFRIYSKRLLQNIDMVPMSNNFLFSFEVIVLAKYHNLKVGEFPIRCDYSQDHTSIHLSKASIYAIQTFGVMGNYLLAKAGFKNKLFK